MTRRLPLAFATLLLLVGAIEGISWIGLRVVRGEWGAWAAVREEQAARAAGVLGPPGLEALRRRRGFQIELAVHPYLGYVKDARVEPNPWLGPTNDEAREFGFPNNATPIFHEPDPSRLVVAVFGGSFANGLVRGGREVLEAELAAIPRFRGREPVIVSLALPGYKQPQQLAALNYLLALGAHFDVVLNLDGYNDIVAPYSDLVPNHVFPAFPKRWFERVEQMDPNLRRAIGALSYLQELRAERVAAFSAGPLRWSLAAGLLWEIADRDVESRIQRAEQALRAGEEGGSYQAHGPRVDFGSPEALLAELVAIWERSSLQMHQLCRAQGIEYHHFLQPNQYVPGSKTLTDEERESAWRSDHPSRGIVERGYPQLQQRGDALRARGVDFHDLTPLYRDVTGTIYVDVCCHVNREGNTAAARAIVTAVRAAGADGVSAATSP